MEFSDASVRALKVQTIIIVLLVLSSQWSPKPVINWSLFTSLASFSEDAVVDNIDEEYDQHLRESAKKVEGQRATKRRLSY
ncbi:hypothetical protein ANCDUO_03392 [Ancylostoma duodenale]|uniref:Uncharacterized protein n=1 Tax=Ancylostoma duodenale TaxID=51022 RepID=A0A0C2H9T4_9BILA|nr:hypothetical protein ANCDUO_03392 [Ancylostoma duodenale]